MIKFYSHDVVDGTGALSYVIQENMEKDFYILDGGFYFLSSGAGAREVNIAISTQNRKNILMADKLSFSVVPGRKFHFYMSAGSADGSFIYNGDLIGVFPLLVFDSRVRVEPGFIVDVAVGGGTTDDEIGGLFLLGENVGEVEFL